MAKITLGNVTHGYNMSNIDVSALFDYDHFTAKPTYLKVFDSSSDYVQFNGQDLEYKHNKQGVITDVTGIVTAITLKIDGATAVSVTGLHADAHQLAISIIHARPTAFLSIVTAGNDTVTGTKFADILAGGAGADTLIGGAGADHLYGQAGKDHFVFNAIGDSTVKASGQDTIYDFSSIDRIDLHAIDANTKLAGNQAFHFIGTDAFSGHAGELRYSAAASDTYIFADVNGDKKADFEIHLDDRVTLMSGHFIL